MPNLPWRMVDIRDLPAIWAMSVPMAKAIGKPRMLRPGVTIHAPPMPKKPPMTPTPGNEALLRELDRASGDLGLGKVAALDPAKRGAGDIGFIAHLLPGLDGLGSGGGENTHAPGESMLLDTMTPMAQRAAILIYRLTR